MKRFVCLFSIFLIIFSVNAQNEKVSKKKKKAEVEESIEVTCDLKKDDVFEANKSVNFIDDSQLRIKTPSSISALFEETPGVTFSSTGSSSIRPVVRGLYDERVLLLVNGIRQEEQFGGGNHTYSIAPEFLNSVAIMKGGASVTFGSDAIGGVINMYLNGYGDFRIHENYLSLFYQTGTDGKKQDFFFSKKIGDFSVYFQGLNKDLGNVETPDGVLKNSYSKGYYFNSGLNYEGNQIVFRLNYYGMQGDLGVPVNPYAIDMGFKNNEYKRVQGEFSFKSYGYHWLGFTILFANQFKHRHMYMELPYSDENNLVKEIFLNKSSKNFRAFSNFIFSHNYITVGLDAFREDAWSKRQGGLKSLSEGLYIPKEFSGVIPPSQRYGYGIFIRDEYDNYGRLKYSFGARYNYIKASADPDLSYHYYGVSDTDKSINFSFGINYKISRNQIFYLNTGTSFRSPSLLERFFTVFIRIL